METIAVIFIILEFEAEYVYTFGIWNNTITAGVLIRLEIWDIFGARHKYND